MKIDMSIPRGIRNNNPLNLRISTTHWLGKIYDNTDGSFEQFDTNINGIRAGAKLLSNYYRSNGLSTIEGIIDRFAPSVENNTKAYITSVCEYMGVEAHDVLNICDHQILASLLCAIILHENGEQPYPLDDIHTAIEKAI